MYGNVGPAFETPPATHRAHEPRPISWPGGFNPTLQPESHELRDRRVAGDLVGPADSLGSPVPTPNVRDELIGYAYPAPDRARPGCSSERRASRHRRRRSVGTEIEIAFRHEPRHTWTYSDFRYTATPWGLKVLDGQRPPGIPAALAAHFLLKLRPPALSGGWGGAGRDAFAPASSSGRFGQHQQRPTHEPLVDTNLRVG